MDMQYIVNPADLAAAPHGRTLVDRYANLWHRPGPNSSWEDGTGRVRNHRTMVTMRGPVYLLPEGFTGGLDLDDLSDAEPGDYVMAFHGGLWSKTEDSEWQLQDDEMEAFLKSPADLLSIYGPLLPAPRPRDLYVRPVSAMEAAAREEEARPVGFWRRLWNGLVWG